MYEYSGCDKKCSFKPSKYTFLSFSFLYICAQHKCDNVAETCSSVWILNNVGAVG